MQITNKEEKKSLETTKDYVKDNYDVMNDVRYVCKSCSLVTDFLKKGCDVMQMPNGDIIVSEVKAVTFHYAWDEKREKMVRVYAGGRVKKAKMSKAGSYIEDEFEDEFEGDDLELA